MVTKCIIIACLFVVITNRKIEYELQCEMQDNIKAIKMQWNACKMQPKCQINEKCNKKMLTYNSMQQMCE